MQGEDYRVLDETMTFEIVGKWGFTSQTLGYSGTLHYQPDQMTLLIYSDDLTLNQHQETYLYGEGTVLLEQPDGQTTYLPVKISLSGVYRQQQQQTLTAQQTQLVVKYGVLGMALGAHITAASRVTAMQLSLSNLTTWLQPAVGSVSRHQHCSALTPADLFHFTVAGRRYQLLTAMQPVQAATTALGAQFSGFAVQYKLGIQLPQTGNRLSELSLLARQVEDWFSIVSGQAEAVTQVIWQLKDTATPVVIFEPRAMRHFEGHDYQFAKLAVPRDDAWLRAMAQSLQNWLTHYDKLIPLATALNPARPVLDFNREVQTVCGCLNVVFDEFYASGKAHHKEVYYRRKVRIFLQHCQQPYVQQALRALPVVQTTNQLLDLIRDARNISAHSSLAITGLKGLTTLNEKYRFQLILKGLLRLWLLAQLGISQQLLAAEVAMTRPFDVELTTTWL
ncbi:hypothetical protein [Lactiplantibacillus daowaiensis]|uniref:ApeA N-terminal domain-containing protein n=1 Tax=Lactiplantibacillus daowaiensis TaxID=2559918 RepID=A0ABW1RW91_9LACO|nr:hypothetical protein [Lactiplantibacillus daowaiensis]